MRNKKDSFCFLYCVAASIFSFIGRAIYPKSHKENVKRLKFNAKRMPMPLSSIAPFEKSNNVSINVYQLDNHKLVAVYYSKNKTSKRRINLLRLVDGSKSHYCLIKIFPNCFSGSLDQRRNEGRVLNQNSVQIASSPFYEKITEVTQSSVSQIHLLKFACLFPRRSLSS